MVVIISEEDPVQQIEQFPEQWPWRFQKAPTYVRAIRDLLQIPKTDPSKIPLSSGGFGDPCIFLRIARDTWLDY